MAALEDTFQGLSGNLQKIRELGYTTVEHIAAANVEELIDGTELTLPDARVAQLRAVKAQSGQGGRPQQQMRIWVKASKDGPAIQALVKDGRLDVARSHNSVAPRLGCYWAHLLPIANVMMFSPTAGTDGQLTLLDTSDVDEDGYVPVDIKRLGDQGRSKDSAICLKFGYLTGWSELPLISAWRQHPALQQKKLS